MSNETNKNRQSSLSLPFLALEESRQIDEQARARKLAANLTSSNDETCNQSGKKREKRVSAPKRMANPFRLVSTNIQLNSTNKIEVQHPHDSSDRSIFRLE